MTAPSLLAIRGCLEGVVPAVIATCDENGTPNVSMLSQVHFVDPEHVALTYQFFNKTRANVLATRRASVAVADPVTMAQYRLALAYEQTQESGPLFESMRAKLAGIASHTGMEGVFRLRGSDVYRVLAIEPIAGETLPPPMLERSLLCAVRRTLLELSGCGELGALFDRSLDCLMRHLGVGQAMVLMLDPGADRLYTVASAGYAASGVGSEVSLGEGVIGAAARERVPVRIGHMSADYAYGAAIRDAARLSGMDGAVSREIPFPGLAAPQSQIAVPIVVAGRTLGVLFAEAAEPSRFGYDEEDALAIIAEQLGARVALLREEEVSADPLPPTPAEVAAVRTLTVRHYGADDSVFLDRDYLIKGVAGAILWKLVREHAAHGRTEFSNRELRLDPALRLPGYAENLEARLVLLHRRLVERSPDIRIEKCGRGRFRLIVGCGLALEEIGADAA